LTDVNVRVLEHQTRILVHRTPLRLIERRILKSEFLDLQTLDAWSSFGSFNGSFNEKQGREKRVGILGFEIANLVMKMMNLRMGLYDEELARFKEEVILSEASRKLISEAEGVLWTIAALDRR
jgi:hypothetical protein